MKIAIIGCVGLPAKYGGFETLAENLVAHNYRSDDKKKFVVYCSSRAYELQRSSYLGAELIYIPFNANGFQSVLYDVVSMIHGVFAKVDVMIVLGVSGAAFIPVVRCFSSVRVVTNIDGVEWQRSKWSKIARLFLRISEWFAVRFSNVVVSDNPAISSRLFSLYSVKSAVIAYGGDHVLSVESGNISGLVRFSNYSVAVCRIEPENNVDVILCGFENLFGSNLVFIGNWQASKYGRELFKKFSGCKNIQMLDPIYDLAVLRAIRERAVFYVHGHSAGGTNPSLVEAMYFSCPIVVFNCEYNRATTEEKAFLFSDAQSLANVVSMATDEDRVRCAKAMFEIANRVYTWESISKMYDQVITGLK